MTLGAIAKRLEAVAVEADAASEACARLEAWVRVMWPELHRLQRLQAAVAREASR